MTQPVPTLQSVLEKIAALPDGQCSPTRKRDLRSAVMSLCKAVGRRPEDVPAIPREIRTLMDAIAPLAHGYSERRWANIRSGVTQSLALVRDLMPSRNTAPIAPEWQEMLAKQPAAVARRVSPACRHFSAKGILPAAVTPEDLEAYCQALINDRMRRNAEQAANDFRWSWNRAVAAHPAWPQLVMPHTRKREGYVHPLAFFPEAFADDVEAYLARLSQGILLDDDDDDFGGPVRPARPATIKTRRFQLRTAASCLARSGVDPVVIGSISALVEINNVRKILHFLMQRNPDGQTSGQVAQMASFLGKLAEHWVKVDAPDLTKLKRLAQRVAVPASGMTAKNRERLRPFDDDDTVAMFLCLPDTIRKDVERDRRRPPRLKARRAQMAAAIALQLAVPLRIANLAAIDINRHLVSTRNGVHLVIPAAETKNREAIDFQIPGFALEIVKWYILDYRAYLGDGTGAGTALFPGRNGGSKAPHTLALQISETIHEFTGLQFNAHLFRHFAGKVFLDANPGNYEVVRQLLRHKRLDTTTSAYAGAETRKAGLHYATLVETLRATHAAPRSRRRP